MQNTSSPATIYRKNYTPHHFLTKETSLSFELAPKATIVSANLHIVRREKGANESLVLDGQNMLLQAIEIDGRALSEDKYSLSDKNLTIHKVPDDFILHTKVEINPESNTALEGLYVSSNNFCTQCEAEGFRKITYYIDRPDNLSVFNVEIIANKAQYPVLLSNGNQVDSGDLADGKHFVKWQDPFLKPSYLFALVAGDLALIQDSYTTGSGRKVDCRIYVEHHNKAKCDYAMASLKHSMRWDEEVYGLEYDLDIYMIVAVDDFNMGAMENKGLNVFNSKFVLAEPNTATDVDYQGIEAVIAHEYFHNWTGNRITCRDWFQLSLKEGLTVFRDQEFSSDMCDRAVKRIQDVRLLRTHQFAEDAGPMSHPIRPDEYIEINNFYTLTVYEKGAEIIRMQHTLLGAENFRKGTDVYFERHDGQAVTCDDFVSAMEAGSGQDLSQFREWYSQNGTPLLQFSDDYNAATKQYTLNIKQSIPKMGQEAPALLVPVKLALLDNAGKSLKEELVLIKEIDTKLVFDDLSEKPVPSLMRDFSAPVNYEYDYSLEQLRLLAEHDENSFARWEATQRLMLLALENAMKGEEQLDDLLALAESILIAVSEEKIDAAFAAELLSMPSERYIAEQQATNKQVVDPDVIHQARENIITQISEANFALLREIYAQYANDDAYSADAESVAYRSIRNTCLSYLSRLNKQDVADLCVAQYRSDNNMTDKMAALQAIAAMPGQLPKDILADFYEQYENESLVVDKWFAVQASAVHKDSVERVKQLLEHSAFSMKVPNKVRALISSFANANPTGFHRADGAGYALLADIVIELNDINPQVASRMVSAFNQWKRYDDSRQNAMKEQLARIAASPNLSKDVSEIVNKALATEAKA